MPHYILVITDTHAGHKLGLCNPNVMLYDQTEEGQVVEYSPTLNATQMHLWGIYEETLKRLSKIANGDEISVIHLGDHTTGIRHPEQLVSNRIADQIIIAKANLEPIYELENLKNVRLTIGTGTHEFEEGTSAIIVGKALEENHPTIDTKVVYHGLANIGGVTIDYSHHGPSRSSRVWLDGNNARYYLKNIMLSELSVGKFPASMYLRGHIHEPIDEQVGVFVDNKYIQSRIIVIPSLCGLSDYARKATRSTPRIINGAIILKVSSGEVSVADFILSEIDVRTKEFL